MSTARINGFLVSERAAAELEILSTGHEDVHGLWEVAAGVNGVLPDQAVGHVLRLTQVVALDLLDRGLLVLRHGHELENRDSELVPVERRETVIADVASWDPFARGDDDPYYTVSATPEGIEEYYRLGHAAASES